MKPTELVYSSHDRSEYLHKEWIIERALQSWDNKTILYIPFSNESTGDQQYSWGTFSGYFDRFRQYGLRSSNFYWTPSLSQGDARQFFSLVRDSEVVILGGGSTRVGLWRFGHLGDLAFGNPNAFGEAIRDRQRRGKLTVGFSAGADQLGELSCNGSTPALGLVRRVIVTLHHGPGGEGWLQELARRRPDCLVFGLPNDSGVASCQGLTARGNFWQHLWFVTDNSWDRPEDQHHIKTRQGVKIEHRYADGRGWGLNGGDTLLRVISPDGSQAQSWIKRPEVPVFHDYHSQQESWYRSVEDILRDR